MEEDRIKKAFVTIGNSAHEGGTDFLIVVGKLLGNIEKPNLFETRAIEYFNKYGRGEKS